MYSVQNRLNANIAFFSSLTSRFLAEFISLIMNLFRDMET